MPSITRLSVALTLALCSTTVHVSAQDSWVLTADEREVALAAEFALFNFQQSRPENFRGAPVLPSLAGSARATERKTVLISVTPVGSRATVAKLAPAINEAGLAERRAIVTRFEYATGRTVRTWVDLTSGDVLRTRVDINYPTPLAAEELDEAIELWRAKSPEIDAAYRDGQDKIQMLHMVPLAPQASSPRYGHRVVVMWLTAPIATRKYVVDLSTQQVSTN